MDRIVTGYPRGEAETLYEEFGYRDNMLDTAEPFGLWVIEGPAWIEDELPFKKAGCNVIFTQDVSPYKLRKVRMLNGAHTSMVLGAYLAGHEIVGRLHGGRHHARLHVSGAVQRDHADPRPA